MIRSILPLSAAILLAGCASAVPQGRVGTSSPPRGPATTSHAVRVPATRPPPPAAEGFRAPKVMNNAGLEGIIGSGKAALERSFGTPRLDVWEGDARKLQFSGEACVLDIYLYPLRPGAEPTATYVEARRASDGLDVDKVACTKALHR